MIIVEVFGYTGKEAELPAKITAIANVFTQKKISPEGFEVYVIPSLARNANGRRFLRISIDQNDRSRLAVGSVSGDLTALGFGVQQIQAQSWFSPRVQPKIGPAFV